MPLVNEERPSWNVAAAEAPVFGVSGVSRRRFLGATAAILTAGLSTDGFAIEPHRVLLSQHDVLLPGLAPRLDGLRRFPMSTCRPTEGRRSEPLS